MPRSRGAARAEKVGEVEAEVVDGNVRTWRWIPDTAEAAHGSDVRRGRNAKA